ncbi:unnamed protein product [Ectocarpus sp. CCAP 1310/34]|nr:unnamed protein product [Ectocarpus sp. CCAP 1310/34]
MLVGEWIPQTLLAIVLRNAVQVQQAAEIPPTRVLQPPRVKASDQAPDSSADAPSVGNVDLSEVQWPEGIKEIDLLLLDEVIEGMLWWVWSAFHSARSDFPTSFYYFPSKTLCGHKDLRDCLYLPGCDQPIDNLWWAPALKSLESSTPSEVRLMETPNTNLHEPRLVGVFDSPFTTLPASLATLWLGDSFCQSLEDVTWPSGLVTLGLGSTLSEFDSVSWSSNLRNLYLVDEIEWAEYPPGCRVNVVMDFDIESAIHVAAVDYYHDLEHLDECCIHTGSWDNGNEDYLEVHEQQEGYQIL